MTRLHRLIIIGTCIALLTGCGGDNTSPTGVRGTIVSAEQIGAYPTILLDQLLSLYDAPISFVPRYGVTAHRIVYLTADAHGGIVEASGALFLPAGLDNLPMISLQHVTQTERSAVASASPVKDGPDALLAASSGYAVCSPDYLGLGVSDVMHPYLHATSSANAVIDFVRACRSYCDGEAITLNGQLFLAGYSEGAYVTLATQRSMEAESAQEFPITAVACLSGPYDLEAMAADVLADANRRNVVYFAYTMTAYNDVYGWNQLDFIFRPPYAGEVRELFNGLHPAEEVESALNGTVGDIFTPEFRAAYADGTATNAREAFHENTVLGWRPVAPIRLYHGTADTIAPFSNAVTAFNFFNSQPGTSISLYPVTGADHAEAIYLSIDPALQWFESLRR